MKISFSRDLLGPIDENGKYKIDGILIEHGRDCWESCWCKYGAKCKYRSKYRFHNMCACINRFFQYRLGWRWFRIPIYIQSHSSDMSGTTLCPHHMPRVKTCWSCTYSCGDRECRNKLRNKLIREGKFEELECGESRRCKLFEPDDWFERYDRKTGDVLFDN